VLFRSSLGAGKNKPFVKVDCAAIPSELIESELFGHEPGSFTGATGRKIGRFEEANHGTLFLDEIGNLDLRIQAKLLNVLQDWSLKRIGSGAPIPLDIHLISASNADIPGLISLGRFREDLYFRLNTITLTLPALKDRMEDIPDLCKQFVTEFNLRLDKTVKGLSPKSYEKLYGYAWPGNVRELKNIIHKAIIFCQGEWITPELIILEPSAKEASRVSAAGRDTGRLRSMKRKDWIALARKHAGHITDMAGELGVTRQTCYDYLKRWKVAINGFRNEPLPPL
jgi:transcriptional regulator with PAS, ATPase and Fis domain